MTNTFEKFNHKRLDFIRCLEENLSLGHIDSDTQACVRSCIDQLREGRFRISVFGKFSSGKSTFLNALMEFDREILVINELASTAAITVLCSPPTPEQANTAIIRYNDSSEKTVTLDEIKDFTAKIRGEDGDTSDSSIEDEIKEVCVYINSPLLDNGVEIIDTPGLNSAYEKHTEISMEIVDESDATILLFNYEQAGNKKEFEFIQLLENNMCKAFLVLNKIDLAFVNGDPDIAIDSVRDDLINKIISQKIELGGKEVYPVSAKYAFEAYALPPSEREQKLRQSRIGSLVEALQDYLCSEEFEKDKLIAPLTRLKNNLLRIHENNNRIIRSAKESDEEISNRLRELKEEKARAKKNQSERIRSIKNSIENAFDTERSNLSLKSDETANEVMELINSKKTGYSLNRLNFSDELNDAIEREWSSVQSRLSVEVSHIVEEVMSKYSDDFDAARVRDQLKGIVYSRLKIDPFVTHEEFTFDDSRIKAIESNMEKIQRDIDSSYKKLSDYRRKMNEVSFADDEIKRLNEKIRDKEKEADNLRAEKRSIVDKTYTAYKYEYHERQGVFGKIGQKLIGKREEKVAYQKSTGEAEIKRARYDEDIKLAEKEREEAQSELREQLAHRIQLDCSSDTLTEKQRCEREIDSLYRKYSEESEKSDKEREVEEEAQMDEFKRQLNSKVRNFVTDFSNKANDNLNKIRTECQSVVKHVVEMYDSEYENLDKEYNECRSLLIKNQSERAEDNKNRENENERIGSMLKEIEQLME